MAIELSTIMSEKGRIFEWSEKVTKNAILTDEDKAISEAIDIWAKKIGNGEIPAYELSQYLVKTVSPNVYNAPSEILDLMFEQDSIGEFDNVGIFTDPINRLNAQETAARTGNADKSYIDFTRGTKKEVHLQIDTEIKMSDLRQNGYKSIALLTQYATEALNNKKFYSIFNNIDSLITNGATNYFTVTGALTVQAMDDFAGYILDQSNSNPLMVGLTTDLRGIKNMSGYDKFLSDGMKGALNMGSILQDYAGVGIAQVNAGKKLADGTNLLPTKKLFGMSDKIGQMYMRGELRVLQTPDNNKEKIDLKFTGFEFLYGITQPEKISKMVIV
jgi:hypothetical protein